MFDMYPNKQTNKQTNKQKKQTNKKTKKNKKTKQAHTDRHYYAQGPPLQLVREAGREGEAWMGVLVDGSVMCAAWMEGACACR